MTAQQKPDVTDRPGRDRRRSRRSPTTPPRRHRRRTGRGRSRARHRRAAAEGRGRGRRAARRLASRPRRDRKTCASRRRPTSRGRTSTRIERFAGELLPVKDSLESSLAAENASLDDAAGRRRAHAEAARRGLREGADRRDRPAGREVRSASASGDGDGRQRPSRPIPSCRCSRRATCWTIACCGRRWSPWRSRRRRRRLDGATAPVAP